MTAGRRRLALAALLAMHAALAINASLLLPLWEPLDEAATVRQAQLLLRGTPVSRESPADQTPQPLASRALTAAGLRGLGLQDVAFLARPRAGGTPRDPARFLHGPDETPPFLGPARDLHVLRLLSVVCGALAVGAAFVVARRLLPQQAGAALLAAASLAVLPPFAAACGALGPVPLQAALLGAALAGLAALAAGTASSPPRLAVAGAALGAAHLAGSPLLVVVPLALLAAWLGCRRDAGRRALLAQLDWLAAGFLLVAGPLFAWRLTHGAAVSATVAPRAGTVLGRWLPLLAWGHVARTAPGVAVGPAVLLAWSSLAALAGLGLLRLVLRARRGDPAVDAHRVDLRVAALLVAAILLSALDSLLAALHGRAPDGRDLLPVGGAIGALLAAGLASVGPAGWPRRSALAGLAIVLGLAALAAWHEVAELGPAFRPLNRIQDPHLLCFDPIERTPAANHLQTVRILHPADAEELPGPPELRWVPVREPDTRYSVHVRVPGASWTLRTFEDQGLSLYDRFLVPVSIWDALPPDVDLELRVVRVPALDEALSGEPLLVDESLPIRVRRKPPAGP